MFVVEVVMKREQYPRPVDRPYICRYECRRPFSRSILLITGVANPESFIDIVQGQTMKLGYNSLLKITLISVILSKEFLLLTATLLTVVIIRHLSTTIL